jgi:hypothetical protein
MSDKQDRANPDHDWKGDDFSASNNDVVAAIAHMKAWAMREFEKLKASVVPVAPPAPKPVVAPVPAPAAAPVQPVAPAAPPPPATPVVNNG